MSAVKCLADCNYKNTEKFSFAGNTYPAKCVKVYDGDSITVVFMAFGKFCRFNVRMDGYDAPELHPKYVNAKKKEEEKKWAIASRDVLSGMILDKIVTLHCKAYDKYGRILGVVELDGKNVNEAMLEHGYCKTYDGGKKTEWDFSKFTIS